LHKPVIRNRAQTNHPAHLKVQGLSRNTFKCLAAEPPFVPGYKKKPAPCKIPRAEKRCREASQMAKESRPSCLVSVPSPPRAHASTVPPGPILPRSPACPSFQQFTDDVFRASRRTSPEHSVSFPSPHWLWFQDWWRVPSPDTQSWFPSHFLTRYGPVRASKTQALRNLFQESRLHWPPVRAQPCRKNPLIALPPAVTVNPVRSRILPVHRSILVQCLAACSTHAWLQTSLLFSGRPLRKAQTPPKQQPARDSLSTKPIPRLRLSRQEYCDRIPQSPVPCCTSPPSSPLWSVFVVCLN